MSDRLPETALDDRKNGEEFWSAAEEFCSCQSDEEDGGNTEFCTYRDYEYFSVGSPLHPKKDAGRESGGPIKNADFQYVLQQSTGSGDEKTGDDKSGSSNVRCAEQDEGPVRQGTSQSHFSITESECDLQSTGSHVIIDSIKSVASKCVEEGTSKEDGKYISLGSTHRRKSSKNMTGKRNSGVNTSRVGLVLGNRQLASVVGSSPSSMTDAVVGSSPSSMTDAVVGSSPSILTDAVVGSSPSILTDAVVGSSQSSMTDHDDQFVFPDQQKNKSSVESKYQQRGHGKRAENILGVHQVHAHHAPKQSEYLLGEETTAKYLPHKHQKTSKKTAIKSQEKSRDNGQENNVQESSRDQSDARTFLREEVSQSDLPTNHLRDIDGKKKSHSVASKSQNAQENENDYNPCQLKDETEDLMILVVSTSPEVSESMEDKVSFSIQGHKENETYEADSEGKEKQQNLKRANQFSKETVDEEAESLSQHSQKGEKNTDADGKEELHVLCNNCLKRLHGSSCDDFPRDELPQNDISSDYSKNGYQIRGQLFEPAKQDARGNFDDSGKSRKRLQENNNDDKMTSLQLSVPAPSHVIVGRERYEVDATYTTKDSFSIRVNKHDKEKIPDTDGKEKPRDNGKHDYVHSSKHPQGPACEGNNGNSFQREDVSENKLLFNNSKNNDVKQNHRLIKGENPNFEGKQDGKRHALSHQTHTEKADNKGKDELIGNRTQDVVHRFEYLNRSCDQNGSTSFQREVKKNDLKGNFLRYDEEKGSDLLIQTKRISRGKLDDSDTPCKQLQRKSVDEFPSTQSRTQELSYPMSDVGKTETNASMKPKGPDVVQGDKECPQYLGYPHNSSRDQSGLKSFPRKEVPLNDRRTNSKEGDEASTTPLIRTNQSIEGKFDNETHVFLTYPRRTKKAGIRRPQGRAPQTDVPTTLRNDEDGTLPTSRTNRNRHGMLDDTDDSCDECQLKNETDLATSIRSSSQEDAKTGINNAKMDTTIATEASFSIRGNMVLSAGSHKKYFYDMWMKGKFCDVNIVVDDHAFLAHRVVLAANSEYFEKFFLNTPVKTDLLTVYISDMSADVFRDILRYMYTGDIDIQFSHVSQLLRGSLFLSIKILMNALQTFLLNTWKGECIGAFCLAQTAGLHDLHKEILNYIRTHFVEVSTSQHFALCPVEHASCILTDDNLWLNEETDILYAVLLWLEHHTRDVSSNLRLLRHVRFEYIPLETIERIEKSHLNSISNESVRRYIQDARKRASCLEVDQLHFDPPIIRQRIAEVAGCRTSRTIDSESITAKNSDRFYKTSDKEKHISSSKEEQTSSYSQGDRSVSPIQKSPSSTKSSRSLNTKAGPFPSYHDIDTTPIRVSVSQDVSASPVASNDDLGERSSQEAEEYETTVQIVRIGGISRTWNEDCVNSDIEKLERRRGKRWEQWTSFAELPVAMHHQAACFIHNSIYISGGHVQLPCDASCNHFQPSRLFHVYDLMKAKWYRLADLEQARVFHQMVALFGQIYVIGGQGHNGGALAAVDRYSPYTDSWRQVAPLSSPRYAVAAATYNFHLWVAGGATNHVTNHETSQNADESQESGGENDASVYDGFYKSSSTLLTGVVECYSPHDNSWTKIKGLPTPRCHASLLRIKKSLFLVGGFSCIRHFPDDDSSTSSVDVYDDVTESWRYVTDVGEGNYGANTVAAGSKIVILGKPGPFLESDGDVISIFDTSTDKWELRRSLLLEARVGHACCAIPVSLHSPLRRT